MTAPDTPPMNALELLRIIGRRAPQEMRDVTFWSALGDGSTQCEWHREDLILEAIVTGEEIETFAWGPFDDPARETTVATAEEAATLMVEEWTR